METAAPDKESVRHRLMYVNGRLGHLQDELTSLLAEQKGFQTKWVAFNSMDEQAKTKLRQRTTYVRMRLTLLREEIAQVKDARKSLLAQLKDSSKLHPAGAL